MPTHDSFYKSKPRIVAWVSLWSSWRSSHRGDPGDKVIGGVDLALMEKAGGRRQCFSCPFTCQSMGGSQTAINSLGTKDFRKGIPRQLRQNDNLADGGIYRA